MDNLFTREKLIRSIILVSAILISSLCWYYSFGLTGKFWYLLWFAPVPVFIIALTSETRTAFAVSFIAFFIGRLSWLSYLATFVHNFQAVTDLFLLSLVFTVILMISRRIILRSLKWYSVFVFPVLYSSFDFLMSLSSPDGTAGSMAYSQSNVLSLVQVVSLTGITGITFIITLFPSAVAVGWYFHKLKKSIVPVVVPPALLIAAVFLFGWIRLEHPPEKPVKIGLSVLQERFHSVTTDSVDSRMENSVTGFYIQQIMQLAKEGAKAILLPERAIAIDSRSDSLINSQLSEAAKRNHVFIIAGYTNLVNKLKRNSALVIDTSGQRMLSYNKVHLVKGFEDKFTAGKDIATFGFLGLNAGVAICKDLDFPGYIRRYGKQKIDVLFVPAWDFGVDDWLHSRMAVLRGVENGFSEVRCARDGRLTVSDPWGRIQYESISADKLGHTLIDSIPLQGKKTLYTAWGNWFGYLCSIISIIFLALLFIKRSHA